MAVVVNRPTPGVDEWEYHDVRCAYDRRGDSWALIVQAQGMSWDSGEDLVIEVLPEVVSQLTTLLTTMRPVLDWQDWQVDVTKNEDAGASYNCGAMTVDFNTTDDVFSLVLPADSVHINKTLVAVTLDTHRLTRLAAICNRLKEVRRHG